MLLKGKVGIVTGASRGIGEAIVKKLTMEGCRVAFTYRSNMAGADNVCRSCKGRARAYKANITSLPAMKKLVKNVKDEFGRLDILVNNAGIIKDKSLMMMDGADWANVINTNLTGAFNAAKACVVTFMKQKSGNILNISSLSAIYPGPGQANYAASKAGLIGFTRALAKELGPYNIRVNAIAPGFIETDMTKDLKDKKDIINEITLKRFGAADEIAELALFLVGPKSSYITGQAIIADGGLAL